MKNPHIIVGEPRRCMCGTYEDLEVALLCIPKSRAIGCGEILKAVERMKLAAQSGGQIQATDALTIATVIPFLIQDCD